MHFQTTHTNSMWDLDTSPLRHAGVSDVCHIGGFVPKRGMWNALIMGTPWSCASPLFSEVWRDEFQWGTSRPMTRARHGAAARFVGSLGGGLQVS